jgi:hypothetical protein
MLEDVNNSRQVKKMEAKYRLREVEECILLDKDIKISQDKVAALKAKKLTKNFTFVDGLDLAQEENFLARTEDSFGKLSCRDKIEYKRMVDTGQIITDASIEQENTLLPKNKNAQNVRIGLGALVLLVSLYIIIKK